jgi:hypothetical protein
MVPARQPPPGHWKFIAQPYVRNAEMSEVRAARASSISGLYGGIHYRTDLEVGMAHGKRIGGYSVTFARTDGAD